MELIKCVKCKGKKQPAQNFIHNGKLLKTCASCLGRHRLTSDTEQICHGCKRVYSKDEFITSGCSRCVPCAESRLKRRLAGRNY